MDDFFKKKNKKKKKKGGIGGLGGAATDGGGAAKEKKAVKEAVKDNTEADSEWTVEETPQKVIHTGGREIAELG